MIIAAFLQDTENSLLEFPSEEKEKRTFEKAGSALLAPHWK